MKTILDNTNFIVSIRQPKNLKKLLTREEFSSETSNQKRVSKCNESKCGTCDILITGNSVEFKNGKRWDIKSAMSCKSETWLKPDISDSEIGLPAWLFNYTNGS